MEKLAVIDLFKNLDKTFKDIYISKVRFLQENLTLEVYVESKNILNKNYIDLIKKEIQEKFTSLNIEIKNKCLNFERFEDAYKDYEINILNFIKEQVPSSKSWLKDLKFQARANILYIYPQTNIIYQILDSNGLKKDLSKLILNELGLKVNVVLDKELIEEDNIQDHIITHNRQIEEESKKISEEVVLEQKENIEKTSESDLTDKNFKIGKEIENSPSPIKDIDINQHYVTLEGEIFEINTREIKNGTTIVEFEITDYTGSMTVKSFMKAKDFERFQANIKEGSYVKVDGSLDYDDYSRCTVLRLKSLALSKKQIRQDKAKEKRVELHLHTKMSSMDAVTNFDEYAKLAKSWGHEAIAITDHGVVQGFPEAMEASQKHDIKVIYGVEGYLIDDKKKVISGKNHDIQSSTYVVFDIETTGLSSRNDKITEIGAVKIKDGSIIDTYHELVDPQMPISEKITELTGITNDMVKGKPIIDDIIFDFYEFTKDSVLVAHNAEFDIGFIRREYENKNLTLENNILDTLELSRVLLPDLKNHKLNTLAKELGINLENHHRAIDDARATGEVFLSFLKILEDNEIRDFHKINSLRGTKKILKNRAYHIVLLVKNLTGLKNLYKIVSESHLNYFYRQPRITRSLLDKYREGLIIGSACEAGELFNGILSNKDDEEVRLIADYYDYLEIQPKGNNQHLIRKGILKNEQQLEDINRKILNLGKFLNKPVIATGDVHFLNPEDEIYRRILMAGQGFGDADNQPPLYFKTTDEMLEEFKYLGEEEAYKVVVENTVKLSREIEDIKPIPDGTYSPVIEGSDVELREMTYNRAREIYGKDLPEIVEKRLERELGSIIKNGYAVMYIISQKLVSKSYDDGYLVGSRGSVGSSFAATMSGITEVNPLVPHYICPKCKYSEFFDDGSIGSGFDLPEKKCPSCGEDLNRDGHDIPFEVFLGFEGDKEPDIDLNFASEYQPRAHKYTEELFGKDYVFRAGTIGTIADKTAYGFIKKYFESKEKTVHPSEMKRLVNGCVGVKRTSGQHPGGVMIVPNYKEIYDFTPIQYPANDKDSGVITTHFDYNAISGRILKLDILGHDVPSIIKMLENFTGIDPEKIPLDDKKTMKLFSGVESLELIDQIDLKVGTLGIPEFGTPFVRQMLLDTRPDTFGELVRISGLSHGTDVWLNNAQSLVRNKIATLKEVISTRDDIMLFLIHAGMEKKLAFKIMEKVRKGRGITEKEESIMRSLKVPEWYIDSCKKIKYMFPKAHAAAYVTMSFRIAYCKVHYPEAFYATYFTTKAQDFDANLILKGQSVVQSKLKELNDLGNDISAKEKNLITVLEVVEEMYARGYKFKPVDLYHSDSDKFLLEKDGILPPLKSLDGVGETAARNIVKARKDGEFLSIDELCKRAKVGKVVLEALKEQGCLDGLPQSNQLSLF